MKLLKLLFALTLFMTSANSFAEIYYYDASDKGSEFAVHGNVDTFGGWRFVMNRYINDDEDIFWALGDIVIIKGADRINESGDRVEVIGTRQFGRNGEWLHIENYGPEVEEALKRYRIEILRDLSLVTGGGTNDDIVCLLPVPECQEQTEPLMIDLGQDGFHLGKAGEGIYFDFEGENIYRPVQWVEKGGNDAFLALDKNNNGKVDDGRELFGRGLLLETNEQANDGFQELAQYDNLIFGGNNDGYITVEDRIWNELILWLDSDANGISTPDELLTLESFGITELALNAKENGRRDHAGNLLRYWAWATNTNLVGNNRFKMVDVYFYPLGNPLSFGN